MSSGGRKPAIQGVTAGSRLAQVVEEYFEALEAGDYRTARVCLLDITRSTSNMSIVDEILRRTYEGSPSRGR
jgi:hypothetical protein